MFMTTVPSTASLWNERLRMASSPMANSAPISHGSLTVCLIHYTSFFIYHRQKELQQTQTNFLLFSPPVSFCILYSFETTPSPHSPFTFSSWDLLCSHQPSNTTSTAYHDICPQVNFMCPYDSDKESQTDNKAYFQEESPCVFQAQIGMWLSGLNKEHLYQWLNTPQ